MPKKYEIVSLALSGIALMIILFVHFSAPEPELANVYLPAVNQEAAVVISSQLIPNDRKTDWSAAGVDGGIPNRTTICATLAPSSNSTNEINSAIANCNNGVVYLSPGTYTINNLLFTGKSNVTLRGAGPGKTILKPSAYDSCGGTWASVCVNHLPGYWWGNLSQNHPEYIYNWIGGYEKGSTVLTLNKVTGLTPGMYVVLDQVNDSSDTGGIFVNDQYGVGSIEGGSAGRTEPGGKRSQMQHVKITAVNSSTNQITISPGLHMPNWRASQNPQVYYMGPVVEHVGIEDLAIDNTTASNNGAYSVIGFSNAVNSWVKNVKSIKGGRNHIWIYQSNKIEVRDSYFYGTRNAQSQSYGAELYGASDNLIVNNIFEHITGPIMMGNSVGSVVAYNYLTDMYYLNPSGGQNNYMQPGISVSHDAGTGMNLFEGNQANAINMDLFHGTGAVPTIFRNQLTGYETYTDTNTGTIGVKTNSHAVHISALNRNVNMIGNVLGTKGYHTLYANQPTDSSFTFKSIYYLGYAACCGQVPYAGIAYDPKVASSMIRWGNYDHVTSQTQWNTGEVPGGVALSTSLPPSLFLESKPSWWGTTSWPAIGPDVAGLVSSIPAKSCFESTTKDSIGIRMFDASACYGQTTPSPTSYSLTVSTLGSGTVTGAGISCGSTCAATLSSGTIVVLVAAPAPGWTFAGWGGACSGIGNCSFTLGSNTSVAATFTQPLNPPPTNELPSVTTSSASPITSSSATLNGSISSTGGSEVTVSGFEYGPTSSYGFSRSTEGANIEGFFSEVVSDLSCNTTYNFRAFARNSIGTGYGANQIFTTGSCVTSDKNAPTSPSNLSTPTVTSSQISLKWAPATDDTSVTGYRVHRNGIAVANITNTQYTNSGLDPLTLYSFDVFAYDAAGNLSIPASISATTLNSPTIKVGSTVKVLSTVKVRSSPAITAKNTVGQQKRGATGTVTGGPVTASGYVWWQVNFASGTDGWVAAPYITAI